ncbi:hypothetical protein AAOGI_35620 [Agarivorans albus]
MSKNAIFKITMLAGAVALAGCTDSIEDPVEPPVEPPEPGTELVIIEDGNPAEGLSVIIGSNTDSYARTVLTRGTANTDMAAIKAAPTTNPADSSYAWDIDTVAAADPANSEVYFVVGSDAAEMDLTDYAAGLLTFDLSVIVAGDPSSTGHQLIMQSQLGDGSTGYLNRTVKYFNQSDLAAIESAGFTTIAVPMSCFQASDTFDLTKVDDLFRFDIRNNDAVTYEIGKVALNADATVPEGAVTWGCE